MDVTIYKLTNKLNGMGYVGMTKNFKRRMCEHRKLHNANTRISKAIAEYGWENFKQEILEICDVSIASEREKFWIDRLETKAPNGYNTRDGGGGFYKSSCGFTHEQRFTNSLNYRKNTAYPNLQAEMDRQKITRTALAEMIGVRRATVIDWLNGRSSEISLSTAIKIKEVLGVDMPLEELFAKATAQQSE